MNLEELKLLLASTENEHLEFKEAKTSFSVLGINGNNKKSVLAYCVAFGNEGGGKLILGVSEKFPRQIVGSQALINTSEVKSQIYQQIRTKINITEIYDEHSKRVVIIDVPARQRGQVLKFYGIPLMRIGEELTEMDDNTIRNILTESIPDWSAQICSNATIDDLDHDAIITAKENYKRKNPSLESEIDTWTTTVFLNKARITINGQITNTAMLLLGKKEAGTLLSPAVAQLTWILKDKDGHEKDYQHFYTPFLLSVTSIYQKIRNLKYRFIKDGSLFPEEVDMYDPYVIRETLHNCIAHQDYSRNSRIQVIESESGYLLFTNQGQFLPGSIEAVIKADSPQEYYKNKFLVDAMVQLNMIDTIGSGIKKMFTLQKERFFPLPSYDLSNEKVTVSIYGKVLDLNYARVLARHKHLSLIEIMLLDQIQKNNRITKQNAKQLKDKGLIEGRYPNLYISEQVAGTTGEIAQYIQYRGFHKDHYKSMIIEYISKKPGATRHDIDELLIGILPKVLTEKQKKNKVTNFLYDLSSRDKKIVNKGNNRSPKWEINN